MNRILVDVNVILDVLLARAPHVAASQRVWTAIETGVAAGLVAAHAITTIHYLIQKELGAARARGIAGAVLQVFNVAAVDASVVEAALHLACPDFEDAVTAAAAQAANCDFIATRDPRGFRGSPVRAVTPEALVPLLTKP